MLKTIEGLNPDKKCFRQIGDTLVEHTVLELIKILNEVISRVSFYI